MTMSAQKQRWKDFTDKMKETAKEAMPDFHTSSGGKHDDDDKKAQPRVVARTMYRSTEHHHQDDDNMTTSSAKTAPVNNTTRKPKNLVQQYQASKDTDTPPLTGSSTEIGFVIMAAVPFVALIGGEFMVHDDNKFGFEISVHFMTLAYGWFLSMMTGFVFGRVSMRSTEEMSEVTASESEQDVNKQQDVQQQKQLRGPVMLNENDKFETERQEEHRSSTASTGSSAWRKFQETAHKMMHPSTEKLTNFTTALDISKHSNTFKLLPTWRTSDTKLNTKNSPLMGRLMHMSQYFNKDQQQKGTAASVTKESVIVESVKEEHSAIIEEEAPPRVLQEQKSRKQIGTFDIKEDEAESLGDKVIPACTLRGLDVFTPDYMAGFNEGQSNLGSHNYLLERRLRHTPTLMVNLVTGHCNIVLYLQLPSFVTQLHDLPEYDTDNIETQAIKRFINGDDDYRNQRIKVIPSLVEGPFAIRVIAPPADEVIIHCERIPVTWTKHEASTNKATGETLHPLLEMEVDLMADKFVRSLVNLCVKNMTAVTVDVGLVIVKPWMEGGPNGTNANTDDEPEACLSIFRFDRVDITKCPTLPERVEVEEQATTTATSSFTSDDLRASKIMGMDLQELREFAKKEQDFSAATTTTTS